ncbi:unnamed protein product [Polarella glacialis]|uniref:Uncharacterized protein n=1 Tax=Polarella glacialis TaxID=89957 RepID=A0A813IWG6_POLGL|nr:unnamed protein product [Polarella glacialis]|mmetsp:Transcript_5241/g.8503  ORF Transcript_5241/g.8503 Transcript_5241/m.8503 type:complete len:435 (+) Transcript_5241:173-1477(+)
MMHSSPDAARQRYNTAFKSSIFEPPQSRTAEGFMPAGKRRDQTTSELFGNYDEKDLRSMPKTFIPKEDPITARRKKMQFLSSEVLPGSGYAAPDSLPPQWQPRPVSGGYPARESDDSAVDANMIRQKHLSSSMFGRETPNVSHQQVHDRSNRLTPNDFAWHTHPEAVLAHEGDGSSHHDRAYLQKCSNMFDYQSPQVQSDHAARKEQLRQEENDGDAKRRNNVYYSDLFGRSAAFEEPADAMQSPRRAKKHGSHEDQMIVHQDWTDARTELLQGRSQKPERPHLRKHEELHNTGRIFQGADRGDWQPVERADSVSHDNSQKCKVFEGMTTQQIHQAHLRTSIAPEDFYREAENSKDWEVVELHIAGLPHDADDRLVRNLCQGFPVQIVKAKADMDPVRNLCKGRAKITVRYNPVRDSIAGLVRHLEDAKLSVSI